MKHCDICGPYFIGKCPHNNLSTKEMLKEVLDWRSDDFGHDCQALLEAESRALQDIGERYLKHLLELKKYCPCGGIILADTEDWPVPMCYECYAFICKEVKK